MLSFKKGASGSNALQPGKRIEKEREREREREREVDTESVVSSTTSLKIGSKIAILDNKEALLKKVSTLEEELEGYRIKFEDQEEELIKKNQELRRLRKMTETNGVPEGGLSPVSAGTIRRNLNDMEKQNGELQMEMRTLNEENRRLFQELQATRSSAEEKSKDLRDRERALGLIQRHFGEVPNKSLGAAIEQVLDSFQQLEEKHDRLRQDNVEATKDIRSKLIESEREIERLIREAEGRNAKLSRTEEQIQELKNELQGSRKELARAVREIESKSDIIRRNEEQLLELRLTSSKEIEVLRDELETAASNLMNLQEELHTSKGDLSRELSKLNRENDNYSEQLRRAEEQSSHLRMQLNEARKEAERMDGEREARGDRLRQLEAQLLDAKVTSKQESDRLRRELESRDEEIQRLNDLLNEANRDLGRRQRDFEVEIAQARGDAERIAREAYSRTERVKGMEEQTSDLRNQLNESRKELEASRRELEIAMEKVRRAEEEVKDLREELGTLERDNKRIQRESDVNADRVRRELDVTVERLKRTEAELISLRTDADRDVVRLQRDGETKTEKLKTAEEKIQELVARVSEDGKEILRLKREIDTREDKLKRMEERVLEEKSAVQKEILRMRKEIDDKSKSLERAEALLLEGQSDANKEVTRLRRELDTMKRAESQLNEVEKEASRLQREESKLIAQVSDLQSEIMELRKDMSSLQRERDNLVERLRRAESEAGESATTQIELDRLRREVAERTERVVRTEERLFDSEKEHDSLRREVERLQRVESEFMNVRMQILDMQMEIDRLKREVVSKTERLHRTEEDLYDCDTAIAAEKQAVIERLQSELAQAECSSFTHNGCDLNDLERSVSHAVSKLSALVRFKEDVANPNRYKSITDHLAALVEFTSLERMGLYDEIVKFFTVVGKRSGVPLQCTDPSEALGPQLKALRKAIADVVYESGSSFIRRDLPSIRASSQYEEEEARKEPAPVPTALYINEIQPPLSLSPVMVRNSSSNSPVKVNESFSSRNTPTPSSTASSSVVRIKSIETKPSRTWRVPLQTQPQPQAKPAPVKTPSTATAKRSKSGSRVVTY